MSSDVFIISSARDRSAAVAIRQAVDLAGLPLARIQDAIFGYDELVSLPDLDVLSQAAGLGCGSVGVSSSLRALFFAADSVLSDDAELAVVIGLHSADLCNAFVLASPEMVGRLNLLPRARVAARSLGGPEPALRLAEIAAADVDIAKGGENGAALLGELLDELEARSAHWGSVSVSSAILLLERI